MHGNSFSKSHVQEGYIYPSVARAQQVISMRNRRLSVCFIGVDGCGKTTHAKNLYEELRNLGIDCAYIHHTYALVDHLPSMIRVWLQRLFLSQTYPSVSSTKEKTSRSRINLTVLSLIAFMNGMVSFLLEPKPYAGCSLVIHDRYLYDHLVHYIRSCPEPLVRCYLRFIPKPDIIFLLDVPPIVAYERRGEATPIFYTQYRKLYLALTRKIDSNKLRVVNTRVNISKVDSLILDRVLRLTKRTRTPRVAQHD